MNSASKQFRVSKQLQSTVTQQQQLEEEEEEREISLTAAPASHGIRCDDEGLLEDR